MASISNRSLRLKKPIRRIPDLAEKSLTEAEQRARFEELSGKRKMEYLTGRWSAKEAFFQRQWEQGLDRLVFKS